MKALAVAWLSRAEFWSFAVSFGFASGTGFDAAGFASPFAHAFSKAISSAVSGGT
jgi:hypothetical protein